MILRAKNLFKTFYSPIETPVLKGVSFELEKGQSLAILGKSGEGKTTLLHILGSLEKPDQGEIEIAGALISPKNFEEVRRKRIGFVFQNHHLLEDFTALDNVLMPAWIARKKGKEQEALSLLRLVAMEHKSQFPVKLLSGGEKQRIAIARSLMNDPDLLLADELSGNLDKENREKIQKLLFELVDLKKKSLILVTHDLELASCASLQAELKAGKLTFFPR